MQCSKESMRAMPKTQIMQPLTGRIESDGVVKVADPRSRPNKRTAHRHGANSHAGVEAGPIIDEPPTMISASVPLSSWLSNFTTMVRVIQGDMDMSSVVV